MSVNLENERKYLEGLQQQAMQSSNAGLLDWVKKQGATLGVTLPDPMQIAQQTAQRQAQGVGVTGPIDPGYINSIATATPFKPQQLAQVQPQPQTTPQTQYTQQQGQYAQQIPGLMDQLNQTLNTPFDPATSPNYNVMVELAKRQGEIAGQQAMEQMNARGILNSTITADRVAKARQDAMLQALPGIMEQALGIRKDTISSLFQQIGLVSGMEEQSYQRAQTAEETFYNRFRQAEADKAAQQKGNFERGLKLLEQTDYVTDEIAQLTGLPVGMLSATARKEIQKKKDLLEQKILENELSKDYETFQQQGRMQLEGARGQNQINLENLKGVNDLAELQVKQNTPEQQVMNAVWGEFIRTGGEGMAPEKLKLINAYVPKEDVEPFKEDLGGYIYDVQNGVFPTPEAAIADVEGKARAGLVTAEYAEGIKAGINAYFTRPENPQTTASQGRGSLGNLLRPMTQEEQTNLMLTPSF